MTSPSAAIQRHAPLLGLRFAACAVLLFCLVAVPPPANAQTYPDRVTTIIVPVGPGGAYDMLARVVAQKLSQRLGQPVIVENKPGAGTIVGTVAAAKAPADGYTLLVGGVSNIALNAGLYKNLPYDPLADFKVVSISITSPYCLMARRDLPQSTIGDLVSFARQNPGKVTYGSAGVGTGQHIAVALVDQFANAKMLHVPYKGASGANSDLLSGRIDLFANNCGVVKPLVDTGKVKMLAVSGRERSPAFPQVPTSTEAGVASYDLDTWVGFFVGARVPEPIVRRLRVEIAAALTSPDVIEALEQDGATRVLKLSPEQAETLVKEEITKWKAALPKMSIALD